MNMLKWLAGVSMALLCMTTNASNLPEFPFVLVKGEARSEVQPDIAVITFEILAYDKSPNNASMVVSNRGGEVVNLLKNYGVKLSDIQSFSLDKQVRRTRSEDYQPGKILGYEVRQRFEVTLRNLTDYSTIMDKLIGFENVNDIDIGFDVTKRDELIQALVKKAAKDARSKAKDLAEGLGSRLGNVFAATQDSNYGHFMAKFGVSESSYDRYERISVTGSRMVGANMFAPKTIELSKTIHVVYKLK